MTDTVTSVLAFGAVFLQFLLALLLLAGLAALVSHGARRALADLAVAIGPAALWLAFAVALIATSGSLFYSEHANFIPCRLCWFQRIGMYPLVVILLGAALRRDAPGAVFYGAPLALLGSLVSAYHLYIEANPEKETCEVSAPCSTKWIDEFGYVTLPMLALTAFLTILVLLAAAWRRRVGSVG